MNLPFVWLGSGRAHKRGLVLPGVWLDEAAKANLPVPSGGFLLEEFYQLALSEKAVVWQDGRLIPQPAALYDLLYEQVRFPRLAGLTAVVPYYDSPQSPAACAEVTITEPHPLAESLCHLWSALPADDPCPRDLLILTEVAGVVQGTAVRDETQPHDLVTLSASESILLPRLSFWQRSDTALPPYAQRLQKLLRGVARTFAQRPLSITWRDDGQITWLLSFASLPLTSS